MDKTQKNGKTIGVKFILGWIIGLICFFGGAANLFKNPIMTPFEIAAGLVVFPPFMQFLRNKTKMQLSTILRIVIFLILLGMGMGLSSAINKNEKSGAVEGNTIAATTPTPTPTPIILDMTDTIGQYDKNKVAVQSKYVGKVIQMTGFIENISSDLDQYYLELAPTNDEYYFGTTIRCYFANKSSLVSVAKGDSVTVYGTLQDTSYETWIELHDCVLSK